MLWLFCRLPDRSNWDPAHCVVEGSLNMNDNIHKIGETAVDQSNHEAISQLLIGNGSDQEVDLWVSSGTAKALESEV